MDPVGRAVWYIESHFAQTITLDAVARAGGLSRFHMSRAFGAVTGRSVMRYVRGRRLTEAAKALADGASDILGVALDAGYGSHEAFTRAFREQFGMTPEGLRAERCLGRISLVEPFPMETVRVVELEQPRYETSRSFLVAGLSERFTPDTRQRIPALWQRFAPHIGHLPGQVGAVAYGVCTNATDDGAFDYVAAVEVTSADGLPPGFSSLRVPEHRYVVFTHRDHVSAIGDTMHTIWSTWLPRSGHEVADAPELERYDERFDPQSGQGGFEIWIPIKG
ncbi:AraC family transcriptional regulator [Marinivivus vitaminiproducens]|uniref:AraC family transcriptional regulator n=1 Tax=Marinivivus vitaminiproducens TaxID=3035935 RepID=UPI00279DE898|nr:AraC family transcriptional regulator [Geminicoccaceae bacterium SCSIO 64248]